MIRYTVFLVFILLYSVFCEKNVEVKLKQGVLAGTVETSFLKEQNYYAFKGVPYAEPPVGELRFLPPKPHQGWENTYQAFENKPTCLQFNGRIRNQETFGISGSEDCLYMDIFTPNLKASLPIIVFDFNDNFKTSFNGSNTYSPDFFVEEGVVVVFIRHRLSLFGYLTTEDSIIPANAGLKDFILGLKWIKENIEQFGGDPTKVTLMGSRGGATLANLMLYTEKASGLFSAVILQSGTAFESIYFYENPSAKAYELAGLLNITASDSMTLLKKLQEIDSSTLIETEMKITNADVITKFQMNVYLFSPTVEEDHDDAIIKTLPEFSKIVNDVPVMIGFNSREGLDIMSMFIFEPRLLNDVNNKINFLFPVRAGFRFNTDSPVFNKAAKEVNKFYLKDGYLNVNNILEEAIHAGDVAKGYPTNFAAKNLANSLTSNVFYFMFDFRGTLNENSESMMRYTRFSMGHWGATAIDELCYLFLCSQIKKSYETLTQLVSEQAEIKVLKKVVRLWTNFSKTRNPTPKRDELLKNVIWMPIEKHDPEPNYLHITKNLKMKKNPLGDRAEFWDNFLKKYSSLAVDGVVGSEDGENIKDEL